MHVWVVRLRIITQDTRIGNLRPANIARQLKLSVISNIILVNNRNYGGGRLLELSS